MTLVSEELLLEAQKLVAGGRHEDYGDKLKNHENIAKLWSAFLDVKISPHDVAICMMLLKIARLKHAHKKDSYIDAAAYSAIAGEIEKRTTNHVSFESEGERRGREGWEYIKSLNKDEK
tara:strand:+ start:4126 stop:4482 length:357 start_codon:yes stop_codon:yes gene_type:complete